MSTRTVTQPIGRQLALTAKLVAQEFNAALMGAGGSIPTWLVLNMLLHGNWSNQHSIAQALGIEGATLTRHLDALEQAGLVVRTRDATDRRSIRVEPTDAGRKLHGELLRAVIAFDKRLRAGFHVGELEQLRGFLLRIEENLGRHGPAAPGA
jgi:MarR family transcriptional regulator, transcriptional regulator for hemolysin